MIRAVNAKDSKEITGIYNHYILNSAATFEEHSILHSDIAERVKKVKQQGLPWLVSEVDDDLEGYAYANSWNSRSAYRFTVEVSVYVSQTCSSNGVGTKLYEALFAELKDLSIHEAIAIITLPNVRSVSLHEKFGMKKVAHLERVGFKFDHWLDVGYWQGRIIA